MKKSLHLVTFVALLFSAQSEAQAPVLGTTAGFALFSTNGAVSNTGLSQLTGNVGTNNGSSTNFGNVDGVMHDGDGATAIAAANLTIAYNQLDAAIPNFFPAPLLGNGQTLYAGTYAIGESASLNNTLILDAVGNPNAVFIFQVQGAFSSAAGAQVLLANGALACNVFWKIEGLVDLATNTVMKGTIVANNAAILLRSGVALEGRALSTTGAITVSGVTVRMPLGCGSPVLTGPAPPPMNTVLCYTVFSGNGEVTNAGVSFVTGDVGTNVGLTTGFQAENVTGTIHENPDTSTAQCASDLNVVYSYLSTLPVDIELLYPAAFGNNLVLTPHTYLLDAATVVNGTVSLNAQNNPDAVFVIKIVGALSTSTFAQVVLLNGAQAKNVFWKIDGATNINNNSNFKGTIIGNNGAMILNNGVSIEGRALSTSGGITTFTINAQATPGCADLATTTQTATVAMAQLYPNPFGETLNVSLAESVSAQAELRIYNALGMMVLHSALNGAENTIGVNLPSGVYYYRVSAADGTEQVGKLVSK
jgi:hypothetical protein